MVDWLERPEKWHGRLLLLAVIVVMVGMLEGAAMAAGEDIYTMVRSKYGP